MNERIKIIEAFLEMGGRKAFVCGDWTEELDRNNNVVIGTCSSDIEQRGGILLPTKRLLIIEIPKDDS